MILISRQVKSQGLLLVTLTVKYSRCSIVARKGGHPAQEADIDEKDESGDSSTSRDTLLPAVSAMPEPVPSCCTIFKLALCLRSQERPFSLVAQFNTLVHVVCRPCIDEDGDMGRIMILSKVERSLPSPTDDTQ